MTLSDRESADDRLPGEDSSDEVDSGGECELNLPTVTSREDFPPCDVHDVQLGNGLWHP